MTTQELVVSVLHSVTTEPNENGDVLQLQEVVVETETEDGGVEREASFRLIWNDDDDQSISIPIGTDLVGLLSSANWYRK